MYLISPDVLAEARTLSVGAASLLLGLGLSLWAAGWKLHQFWVVFGVTLAAGTFGLNSGTTAGGPQVLIVGVLMAVAAGLLAMELAKILACVTGGTAAWGAAQAVFPQANELWAVFLVGGILGVALFRLWAMLATSFAGVLIGGHAALVLLGRSGKWDAAEWSGRNGTALAGVVAVLTVAGVFVQARLESQGRREAEPPEEGDDEPSEEKRQH